MSEVPEGVDLSGFVRKPPRPTATMTLTRDGPNGPEVLLGLRSETMAAFPGYWAFTGVEFHELTVQQLNRFQYWTSSMENSLLVSCARLVKNLELRQMEIMLFL